MPNIPKAGEPHCCSEGLEYIVLLCCKEACTLDREKTQHIHKVITHNPHLFPSCAKCLRNKCQALQHLDLKHQWICGHCQVKVNQAGAENRSLVDRPLPSAKRQPRLTDIQPQCSHQRTQSRLTTTNINDQTTKHGHHARGAQRTHKPPGQSGLKLELEKNRQYAIAQRQRLPVLPQIGQLGCPACLVPRYFKHCDEMVYYTTALEVAWHVRYHLILWRHCLLMGRASG